MTNVFNENIKEQLLWLKSLTVRTNIVHDAQILHLRFWPLLLKGAKSAEIKIDTDNKTVFFEINISLKNWNLDYNKTLKNYIVSWVQYLLWNDTKVVFLRKNNEKTKRFKRI